MSQRYAGAAAETLSDLHLAIARGEAHALLGGSGAGKTTLINLLSGLLTPSAGTIRFDGRDVTAVAPRDRGVAQVFQFPVLYPSLTVGEMLAFPLRNRGWRRGAAERRAREIAGRLALDPWLDTRTPSLSLFQRQLVAIGRALVRPDIALVLLDEPLTAVEPATKWQLRRAIKDIQAELGATMVYVTHDQTEALTFADRISVVRDGRLLQTGTPEDLYERPVHEHVAHFIGSPGMNLLGGEVRGGALCLRDAALGPGQGLASGPCTLGFRPEWAVLRGGGGPARVTGVRVLGVENHRPVGIVTAELYGQVLRTRQAIDVEPGARATLQVDGRRVLAFRDGRRLTPDAGVA